MGRSPPCLAPCTLPSTSRTKQKLRWMHISGLAAPLFPASPCCQAGNGGTGSRRVGRDLQKSLQKQMYLHVCMCVMGVQEWGTSLQPGKQPLGAGSAKRDGAEQQGEAGADLGWVERVRQQHLLLSAGGVRRCKACRSSNEAKARRSHQHPNAQRALCGAGTGAGWAALTYPHTALHHRAHHSLWRWGNERSSSSKEGSRTSHIHVGVSQCLCLAVAQIGIFLLWQYQCATN